MLSANLPPTLPYAALKNDIFNLFRINRMSRVLFDLADLFDQASGRYSEKPALPLAYPRPPDVIACSCL